MLVELTDEELSIVKVCCTDVPTGTLPKFSDAGVIDGSTPLPLSCRGEPSMTKPVAAVVTVNVPITGSRAVGLNTIPTVQLAPAAKLMGATHVPVVVVVNGGPLIATLMPAIAAPLVLVSVTSCVGLVAFTNVSENSSDGLGVTRRSDLTPLPFSGTGAPRTAAFAVMVTEPVDGPATVGRNLTMIVQVPGGVFWTVVRAFAHVPPCLVNPAPVTLMAMPVKFAEPTLNVNVCVGARLADRLVGTFPNPKLMGATDAVDPLVNCTAPMSIFAVLELPKKSLPGAPEVVPLPMATEPRGIEYAPCTVPNALDATIISALVGVVTFGLLSVSGP
jgi:hypothetical protein